MITKQLFVKINAHREYSEMDAEDQAYWDNEYAEAKREEQADARRKMRYESDC